MTRYMPLFRSCNTIRTLVQLHAHLLVSGLYRDPLASTKLIESYAQMGSLKSSRTVFETFQNPDFFMRGVLMKSYVRNNSFEEVIALYHEMLCNDIYVNRYIYPSVLRAFSTFGDLSCGMKLHGRLIKCGFDDDDEIVKTSLVQMYGQLGCFYSARKVFDEMPVRDVVAWSSVIACAVENGEVSEGLEMFRSMVSEGVEPDSVAMLSVVNACGDLGSSIVGRSVHGYIAAQCISTDGWLGNSLITMYSKYGDSRIAEIVFGGISNPGVSSWTAMISCYNQTSRFGEALETFRAMKDSNVEPNSVTMTSVLRSCAGLDLIKEGKSVHCFAIRKALDFDILKSALLELYASCGRLCDSEKILLISKERNVVPWNSLMSCYSHQGFLIEALLLFRQMRVQGLMPDSFSLSSSLTACGNVGQLELGWQIHCHVIKRGFLDEYVQNSLIDMYCKCGFLDSAFVIFDELEHKSVVAWNCMMNGYSQSGYSVKAIELFDGMFLNRLEMDEVTFLLAIQACSQLGYFEKGKWVHNKIITYGVRKDVYIGTSLIDMYAKCGLLQTAQQVFDAMPEKSIVSWSVMIGGYGLHGKINQAISLFAKMLESGIRPNEVVFTNVLSACSHSGYVEEGKHYFKMMKDFGIEPNAEHFACIVDLLSRAGNLEEAYGIVQSMPVQGDSGIWSTMVNGCRIHQRLDMLDKIQRHIWTKKIDGSGYYALLSNIYAEGGNWDEFGKFRSNIDSIGLKKVPGYSSIEV